MQSRVRRTKQPGCLADVIRSLRNELERMQRELADARDELSSLRSERARAAHALRSTQPNLDLGALRRQLAFYCHPDRGGDPKVMRGINTLFDFLMSQEP